MRIYIHSQLQRIAEPSFDSRGKGNITRQFCNIRRRDTEISKSTNAKIDNTLINYHYIPFIKMPIDNSINAEHILKHFVSNCYECKNKARNQGMI